MSRSFTSREYPFLCWFFPINWTSTSLYHIFFLITDLRSMRIRGKLGLLFFTILERFVCRLAFRLLFSHYIFQFIPNLIQLPFFVPFSLSWWQFFSLYFEFLFRGKFQPSVSRVESLFRVKTWSSPISITIYPSPTVVSFFGLSSSSKLESTRLPFLFGSILSLIGKKKIWMLTKYNKFVI